MPAASTPPQPQPQPQQGKSPPPAGAQPTGKVAPPTAALKTWPHRLMPRLDEALARPRVQALAVLALVMVLALLLGPSFRRSDAVWEQLRVGARAQSNIKATRSFDYYPSEEEIERQRRAAAEKVLPVFDHHVDLVAIVPSRINQAFQAAGSAGAARGAEEVGVEGTQLERFAKLLQTDVDPRLFATLREANFSPEARATTILLVGSALDQLVVAHRGALDAFEGGAVALRHMAGGRVGRRGEETLRNLSQIKDLAQVKEQLANQAKIHGAKLESSLRRAVAALADSLVVPNVVFNPVETRAREDTAMRKIEGRPIPFVQGQVIVLDGAPITREHLRILKEMEGDRGVNLFQVIVGIALFVLLIMVTAHHFGARQFRRFAARPRDVAVMGLLLLVLIGLTKIVMVVSGQGAALSKTTVPYLLPLAAGAMLVRLLITAEAAALFTVMLAALVGLMVDRSLGLALFVVVTGTVGAYGVRQVQSRSTVLRAGLFAGLLGAAAVVCLRLFGGEQLAPGDLVYGVLAAISGGLLAAFVTLALLPVIEWLFAYTTEVTLLELANLNHPLLRDLMLRAPGTYHHSMVVGSLAETACEAIGANGLLARVAANYHDVGKMKNPAYFAENLRAGEANPHNRLKPSMSALIIRNHVKDGIEMLSQHGIPQLVVDTASQHHGRALIAFFYHKAQEQTKDDDEDVLEDDYRYPGPKPQSREAGVLMLADGVEAAARSLNEPTPDRVQALVQRIINTRFTDGQLNYCDLTLRDLHMIAKSFMQVLSGIYHGRPTYPWQRGDESRRPEEGRKERKRSDDSRRIEDGRKERRPRARDGSTERQANGERASRPKGAAGEGKRGKPAEDRVEGQRKGETHVEPAGASEIETGGSQDIKRLGLN